MKRKVYHGLITNLKSNQIFVFGSNPEGRHGKGTAKIANEKFGAKKGIGRGLCGQSYALVTKNLTKNYFEPSTQIKYTKTGLRSVSEIQIIENIKELYHIALEYPEYEFFIAFTKMGINLNGYTSIEMANMFQKYDIPSNIVFEDQFYSLFSLGC